jgi:hypothetical protein
MSPFPEQIGFLEKTTTELSLAATLRLCRYTFLKNFRRKERSRTHGAATFF